MSSEVNHTQEKLGFRGELAEATTLEITGPFSRQLLTGSYAKEWWERDARYQYVPDFYREATPILLGERGA